MKLRSKQRGAALVEATVVIPVLLVFLGLIMYSAQSYGRKIDAQMNSRATTMLYASRACDGDAPDSISSRTEDDTADLDPGLGNKGDEVGSKLDEKTQAGISRTSRLVTASNDVTVSGKAIVDDQSSIHTEYFNQNIHSYSQVACNEHVYDGFFSSMIGFAKDIFKNGLS